MEYKVYRIVINEKLSDISKKYKNMKKTDKYDIYHMDIPSYFDYETSDQYVVYMISSEGSYKFYKSILDNYDISYISTDLSNEVISFKENIKDNVGSNLNGYVKIKWELFKNDLESWISTNLTIDNVLDRINELGSVKKLSKVEKDFLKNLKIN